MPRFLGFVAVLLSLPFSSARAAIVPGPEISPTRTVMGPPAFDQTSPRIASSGNGSLAVWNEYATVPFAVHATRLAADGTPLDGARPLVIAESGAFGDVVWDGRRYLVVWVGGLGIEARFVETDGTMSEPFRVSSQTPEMFPYAFPRVTFNGRTFFVAWVEFRGPRFAGALIDANGVVTKHLDLGDAETWSSLTAVAAVNETFYLAAIGITHPGPLMDLVLTTVREDGSIGPRTLLASAMPYGHFDGRVQLQAVSRGDDALAAWSNTATTWTVRITGSGPGTVESFEGDLNALVSDPSGYAVVYDDANGRRLRRAGGATFAVPAPAASSRVLAAAGSLLIASVPGIYRFETSGMDLSVQDLDDGTFTPLTTAAQHQISPHIAAAGSLRLAAWTEVRGNQNMVVAARLGPQGTPLDPEGIEVGTGSGIVRVAAGPGQWLIAWRDGERVRGSRIAFDGTLLDAQPFVIADPVFFDDTVAAAWDGEHYIVLFLRGVQTRVGARVTLTAARVGADATIESPFISVSDVSQNGAPAIAAGRDGSLIVWINRSFGSLEGALLSRSGTVTPVDFPWPSRYGHRDIDVAWNGQAFLVAAPVFNDAIRWFFVTPTGVVTPAPASAYLVSASPQFRIVLDVEPLGDEFLIAYESNHTLYAATINRAGYVAHGPVAVGTTTIYDRRIGAAGTTIVYARNDDPLRAHTSRVFVRELAIAPNPPKRRALR